MTGVLVAAALLVASHPALAGKGSPGGARKKAAVSRGIVGRTIPPRAKKGANPQNKTDNYKKGGYRNEAFASGGQKLYSDPLSRDALKTKLTQKKFRAFNAGVFISQLGMGPGMSIADIGAGPGTYTEFFARAVRPGGQVWASEADLHTVRLLHRRVRARKLRNVTVLYSYYDDSLLPADTFDIALMVNVHVFAHPESDGYKQQREMVVAFYKTVARGLKEEGRLAIFEHIGIPSSEGYLPREEVIAQLKDAGFRLDRDLPTESFRFSFHSGCHFMVFRRAPEATTGKEDKKQASAPAQR